MTKKPLVVALLLSLLFNACVVAGFCHQRYFPPSVTSVDAVSSVLGLSTRERAALVELRRSIFAGVGDLRKASAAPNAQLRRLVATRRADDPELTVALARIADERARIQVDAITRIIAFRDNLSLEAQQRFRRELERPGFLLSLFGVTGWGLPQAAR